jgi:hypothetical protein
MPPSPPHLRGLRLRSIVRIDVHGSKDRAKDASPGACDDLSCLRRVHALLRACRRRSPPRRPPDIRRHRRVSLRGRIPTRIDGPTEALFPVTHREARRLPEDQDAFHRYVTRRNQCAEGLLPPAFAPALSLTPPTLFPQAGDSALVGHCKATVRSPAGPWRFESTDTFSTPRDCRAWD